jgi:uncharacterized protein
MRFVWDETKNRANLRKHKISFEIAANVFEGPMLIGRDECEDYEEARFIGVGMVDQRFVVVIYSESEADVVRIISARKALRHEREAFQKTFKG